jgi:hypothetical protein
MCKARFACARRRFPEKGLWPASARPGLHKCARQRGGIAGGALAASRSLESGPRWMLVVLVLVLVLPSKQHWHAAMAAGQHRHSRGAEGARMHVPRAPGRTGAQRARDLPLSGPRRAGQGRRPPRGRRPPTDRARLLHWKAATCQCHLQPTRTFRRSPRGGRRAWGEGPRAGDTVTVRGGRTPRCESE